MKWSLVERMAKDRTVDLVKHACQFPNPDAISDMIRAAWKRAFMDGREYQRRLERKKRKSNA